MVDRPRSDQLSRLTARQDEVRLSVEDCLPAGVFLPGILRPTLRRPSLAQSPRKALSAAREPLSKDPRAAGIQMFQRQLDVLLSRFVPEPALALRQLRSLAEDLCSLLPDKGTKRDMDAFDFRGSGVFSMRGVAHAASICHDVTLREFQDLDAAIASGIHKRSIQIGESDFGGYDGAAPGRINPWRAAENHPDSIWMRATNYWSSVIEPTFFVEPLKRRNSFISAFQLDGIEQLANGRLIAVGEWSRFFGETRVFDPQRQPPDVNSLLDGWEVLTAWPGAQHSPSISNRLAGYAVAPFSIVALAESTALPVEAILDHERVAGSLLAAGDLALLTSSEEPPSTGLPEQVSRFLIRKAFDADPDFGL